MFRSPYKYFGLTLLLIVIDQIIKLAVHYFMKYEGNEVPLLGEWFKLHYVLNRGMAFGITLDFIPKGYGKIVLSLFRIFAMFGIGYYLTKLASKKAHEGYFGVSPLFWGVLSVMLSTVLFMVFS